MYIKKFCYKNNANKLKIRNESGNINKIKIINKLTLTQYSVAFKQYHSYSETIFIHLII